MNRTKYLLLYFLILITIGATGFHLIGGKEWGIVDSIYMTVITVSTVGFGEVNELNQIGKLWTVLVIIFGVSGYAIFISQLGESIMEIREKRRERVKNILKKLRNHYIIFGYGRMGAVISSELTEQGFKFVIVENDDDKIIKIQEKGYQYFRGDATADETLENVGIKYAKGVVVTLGTEQDNLFVTMSIRTLNSEVFLLSRCRQADTSAKLKRAGADKVVNPYVAGGQKMAELLLAPNIEDAVMISTPKFDINLVVEEINVKSISGLSGISVKDSKIRNDYNLIIIGVKDNTGKIHLNPEKDFVLSNEHTIMLIGPKEKMKKFTKDYLS